MDVFGGKFWVQGLFGVWIFTLIRSCPSLKSRVLPWGMTTSTIGMGELNFEISDIGLGFKSESRIRSPPRGFRVVLFYATYVQRRWSFEPRLAALGLYISLPQC